MDEATMNSDGPPAQKRVMIVAGYFDWFSGYQETALARALQPLAKVEIVASDRVSPAFSDSHLRTLGVPRRYNCGQTQEHGAIVTRFNSRELRSMVWSNDVVRHVNTTTADLIIQVMPGQLMSAAPTLSHNPAPRAVLYGDNRAMWSHLPRPLRLLKGAAFTVSKGLLYTIVNARARTIYGYTPDTQRRLRAFRAGKPIELMPLSFSANEFYLDEALRLRTRAELRLEDDAIVILSAGKTDPRKRLEWLIEAYGKVASHNSRIHLIIVGDDGSQHSQDLHEQATTMAGADRIRFLPFADACRLNAIFNAADIGVWPRNPAITIQQGLATGLATVLPRNELVGHLMRPGSGHYFDLSERSGADVVATALSTALANTDLRSTARKLRATTNSWLSGEATARRLLLNAAP